jgi:hypothetical protein
MFKTSFTLALKMDKLYLLVTYFIFVRKHQYSISKITDKWLIKMILSYKPVKMTEIPTNYEFFKNIFVVLKTKTIQHQNIGNH